MVLITAARGQPVETERLFSQAQGLLHAGPLTVYYCIFCDGVLLSDMPLNNAATSVSLIDLAATQIKWISELEPTKGFDYLYLSDADHQAYLTKHTAANLPYRATEVPQGPELPPHWRLSDIIGAEDGLGVECLSGSGAIAAAFSRSFHEGFTITLVSGRNVGIGAYLARLGRRYALLLAVRNTACCVLLLQKRSVPFPIAVLATTQHSAVFSILF